MKVITSNVYAWNREQDAACRVLTDTDAVVIGAQEAWRFPTPDGYTRHGEGIADGSLKGAAEVPVFLRREGTTFLGEGHYKVTPDLGSSDAPDRWITWVRFAHAGHRWCLLNTHVNAALQDRDTGEVFHGQARVLWAQRHMEAIVREVKRQRRDGFRPLVTADANYYPRPGQTDVWDWSPHVALAKVRMVWHGHRLDGIGTPSTLDTGFPRDFELPGSDHRSLAVRITLP